MKIRSLISIACVLALAAVGCAGSSEENGTGANTTPAAAQGGPATVEPQPAMTQPAPAAPAPAPTSATEPTSSATPAASTTQPQQQMPTLGAVVTHKVKDFDAWKTVFDADQPNRQAAGIVGHGIMRDATNDKIVSLWLPATDAAKFKAFGESKELKDKMKEGGVIGKPEIIMMNTVAMKMDPAKQGLSAAMVTLTTKDFAAFKTAFEAEDAARTTAGVVGYGLGQDTTNANVAHLYLQSDDVAKLKAYVTAKETQAAWKEAGVKGAAKTSYVKEGEMKMYQ